MLLFDVYRGFYRTDDQTCHVGSDTTVVAGELLESRQQVVQNCGSRP